MKRLICLVVGCTIALLASSVTAQSRDAQRALDAARQRVEVLLERAVEAERAGEPGAASVARSEAEQLARRIDEEVQRRAESRRDDARRPGRDRDRDRGPDDRRELTHALLEHLEHGMRAARELDAMEIHEALEHIADRVRTRLDAAERGPRRDRPRDERAAERFGERRGGPGSRVDRIAEALRHVGPILHEVEHLDGEEMLELGLRVLEMTRGDGAPRRHTAEMLESAADVWAEFEGGPEVERLRDMASRLRDRGPSGAERHRRVERRERLEALHDELRALRERIEELHREMERDRE